MESCAKVISRFPEYVEGSTSREVSLRVAHHLSACSPCRQRVEAERRLVRALNDLPRVSVPADFRSSVMGRVVQAPLPVKIRPCPAHLKLVHLLLLSLAALGAASLGLGFRAFSSGSWVLPNLLDPAQVVEWIRALGQLALSFMLEIISRAGIPHLLPSFHLPFTSTLLAAITTVLLGLGLAASVLGLGVLATARAYLTTRRS